VCYWCSYHILMSSVVYYWTDGQRHGVHLYYIVKKWKIKHVNDVIYMSVLQNARIVCLILYKKYVLQISTEMCSSPSKSVILNVIVIVLLNSSGNFVSALNTWFLGIVNTVRLVTQLRCGCHIKSFSSAMFWMHLNTEHPKHRRRGQFVKALNLQCYTCM